MASWEGIMALREAGVGVSARVLRGARVTALSPHLARRSPSAPHSIEAR